MYLIDIYHNIVNKQGGGLPVFAEEGGGYCTSEPNLAMKYPLGLAPGSSLNKEKSANSARRALPAAAS